MPRKKLRVAACQIRFGEDIAENADRIVAELKACAKQKVDVVAFQEGALFGYTNYPAFWENLDQDRLVKAEQKIIRTCKRAGIATVVGTSHLENGVRYNSLLVVDRDGTVQGRYGKIHLAGEKWCAPAQHLPIYKICGVACCFIICHDVRYPELVRLPAAAGAKVCFFCSCESTMLAEYKLSAYRAMPISRATENGIFLVMANAPAFKDDLASAGSSHGESKVVHPDGNVMVEAGIFTEETLIQDLDLTEAGGGVARRALNDVTCLRDWMRDGLDLVDLPTRSGNGRSKRVKVLA